MSSNQPVKNGCEVIYEMFHISSHYQNHSTNKVKNQRGKRRMMNMTIIIINRFISFSTKWFLKN